MKNNPFCWPVLLLAFLLTGCTSMGPKTLIEPPARAEKKALRLAFGSCNNEEKSQEFWREINQYFSNSQGPGYPAAWIWAGDVVYADTNDLGEMQTAYGRVKNGAYHAFQQDCEKAGCRVVGIWDDHDFGGDNLVGAGEDGAPFSTLSKQQRKALLVDFLGEPTKAMVAGHEQMYAAYDFYHDGVHTRLIILDLRYDRQDPGPDARIIGNAQWQWLEKNLTDKKVNLQLIVSSTQVLRKDKGKDTWEEYPQERERLLKMIGASPAQGVVLLTGDIHAAEISVLPREEASQFGISYDLYEITASGLNRLRCYIGICSYAWKNTYQLGFAIEHNFGEIDIARSADGAIALLATLRASESPSKVLLRKNISFAKR